MPPPNLRLKNKCTTIRTQKFILFRTVLVILTALPLACSGILFSFIQVATNFQFVLSSLYLHTSSENQTTMQVDTSGLQFSPVQGRRGWYQLDTDSEACNTEQRTQNCVDTSSWRDPSWDNIPKTVSGQPEWQSFSPVPRRGWISELDTGRWPRPEDFESSASQYKKKRNSQQTKRPASWNIFAPKRQFVTILDVPHSWGTSECRPEIPFWFSGSNTQSNWTIIESQKGRSVSLFCYREGKQIYNRIFWRLGPSWIAVGPEAKFLLPFDIFLSWILCMLASVEFLRVQVASQ